MCKNKIVQLVPTKFHFKEVEGNCGQTGVNGEPIYCEKCTEEGAYSQWKQQQHDLKYNDY